MRYLETIVYYFSEKNVLFDAAKTNLSTRNCENVICKSEWPKVVLLIIIVIAVDYYCNSIAVLLLINGYFNSCVAISCWQNIPRMLVGVKKILVRDIVLWQEQTVVAFKIMLAIWTFPSRWNFLGAFASWWWELVNCVNTWNVHLLRAVRKVLWAALRIAYCVLQRTDIVIVQYWVSWTWCCIS